MSDRVGDDPLDPQDSDEGWVIPGVIPFDDDMADEYPED